MGVHNLLNIQFILTNMVTLINNLGDKHPTLLKYLGLKYQKIYSVN